MKFKIDEIELAINHIKKQSFNLEVNLSIEKFSGVDKLLFSAKDKYETDITIELCPSDLNRMPRITQTSILTKESK